ncbi:MAG: hypothetical protein KGL48_05740 [Sphingomonadales bacterium]|nr:hypothetical protein [Sphingomonadales bacterium]MDE2569776.1 hypothetical protein [Sphingomonadales bacterium]
MNSQRHLLAVSSLTIAALAAVPAHAAGVAAGTLIQNTASATYTSGTSSGSVQSNTVSVKVDQLLDVAVATLDSSPVTASSSSAVLRYQLTNTGNGADTFSLAADPAVAGNPYNGVVQTVAVDSNNNGVYDPGTDLVVNSSSVTPQVLADGKLTVFVVVSLPAGATDTQTSQVRLTVTSAIGSGTPGTVFAGKGVGGVDAVVGLSHATQSALDAMVASLATVTLTKSATVADPFGGSSPVPGAIVTYSIVAHATGSGTADGLHVTDAIPTGTTYQAGSLKLGATALTDAADGDAGQASAAGIDVSLGSMAGGSADQTVTFKVKINP